MKKLAITSLIAILLPFTAHAQNVCLSFNNNVSYALVKVGSLTKGSFKPITGIWDPGFSTELPLFGTLIVKHDGTVKYAFIVESVGTFSDSGLHVGINGGVKTLAGTGRWDTDGDGAGDADVTVTVLNCKDLPGVKTF